MVAAEDLAEENRMIETANKAFADDLESAPFERHEYLVSFEEAVPVGPLLEAVAHREDFDLIDLHLWLAVPGSEDAPTGSMSAEYMGWPASTPEEASQTVEEQGRDYLEQHIQSLRGSRGSVVREQLREAQLALAALDEDGSVSYGLLCNCSPEGVQSLERSVEGLSLRAVEEAGFHDQPFWLEDVLRERIIESGGTYGRTY